MSAPGVKFLYVHCQDLSEMRQFYSGLLEFDEIYFSADEGMVAYNCDGLQFTLVESADVVPLKPDRPAVTFARQPGWSGGTGTSMSWSTPYDCEAFTRVVAALQEATVEAVHTEPAWVGYWSYPVLDPMGTTVEITSTDPVAWRSESAS